MEENLAGEIEEGLEPRGKGVDEAGRTFRKRIEVTLEDDRPEWDEEEAELDFWRARRKVRPLISRLVRLQKRRGIRARWGSNTVSNCEILLKQ
jgi:hypothetical protein